MHLDWTPEQLATRERFASIGRTHAKGEASAGFDLPAWKALTEAGFWKLPVPRESGGAGGDWWDFAAAFEGVARTVRSPALLMSMANQASIIRALLRFGTPAQQGRLLRPLLEGALSATAIAEAATGSDLRALQTRVAPDGAGLRLDGGKVNISHAPTADILLVVARSDEGAREGLALVLLDRDRPGLRRGAGCATLGNADLPIGDLHFDAVRLTSDDLLGADGDAGRRLQEIAVLSRLLFALGAACVIEPFLADAMDTLGRRGTSAPLDSHQHVQRRLVDVRYGIERTRWLSYAALHQLLARADEMHLSASLAKLSGADALVDGALELLRLAGSAGYREGALATFVRDALALPSVGGTTEMHRINVFNQMVRLHRRAGTRAAA
jgi:isovaleryl-CoA dehydrogenase